MSNTVEIIKDKRIQIDALINQANSRKYSSESTLAWRSLQMAKSWLGVYLALSDPHPYEVVDKIEDIPPTRHVSNEHVGELIGNLPRLRWVNSMRESIQGEIDDLELIRVKKHPLKDNIQLSNVYTHLKEAKMWYGFCLAELRDKDN